jgi:hypothetical protein
VFRRLWMPLISICSAFSLSCGLVEDALDNAAVCSDACLQVQDCDAEPPTPEFGSIGAVSSGEGGLDCAASCTADDRELRGYSDCQIECINNVECGQIQDCWKPRSDTYAQFCLQGVEVPDLQPPDDEPAPGNGTNTGNQQVDDIVEDPAVAIAVDDAEDEGFELNYGDTPPTLEGRFQVSGTIDATSNARPVGSPIETTICFWNYEATGGGVQVSYCEDGVPGQDTAPLTGSGDAFTAYFDFPGQATIMFSGSMNGDGTLSQVEALVVYTYATDVWELSHTDWQPIGTCNSCE